MKEYTVKDLLVILQTVDPRTIVTLEDTVLSRDGKTENNAVEDIIVVESDWYDVNGKKNHDKIVIIR